MTPTLLALFLGIGMNGAAPVMRVVKSDSPAPNLLRNGGFEQARAGGVTDWQAWQKGFHPATGQGRNGSQAIVCENLSRDGEYGASQTLILNRTTAAPLVVRGWSKAENVS